MVFRREPQKIDIFANFGTVFYKCLYLFKEMAFIYQISSFLAI